MPNPRGTPQKFLTYSESIAEQPVSVKLPVNVDAWVRSLPNRTEWLRKVIAEAAKAEMEQHS